MGSADAVELRHAEQCCGGQRLGCGTRRADHDARNSCDLRGDHGHQQRRRQWITSSRHVAADGVNWPDDLSDLQAGLNFAGELLRFLPFGELADVLRGGFEGMTQIGRDRGERGRQFLFAHAKRSLRCESVPFLGEASKSGIALRSDILNYATDGAFGFRGKEQAAVGELRDLARNCAVSNYSYARHYITTLFSGYSTIPCAFAAFRRGMISRAVVSSMMVFTATHCSPLSAASSEMVGRFNAGRTAITPARSCFLHIEHQPDAALRGDGAAKHQCEVLDLLAFHVSCIAFLFAMTWVSTPSPYR